VPVCRPCDVLACLALGLQDFIRGLVPKEERFFDLLERQGRLVHDAALALAEFGQHGSVAKVSAALQELEHQGDALVHEIEETLAKTYVTPIDREDIHSLAGELDDVLDLANQAARACELLGVDKLNEPMIALAGVLVNTTAELSATVPLLRQRRYADIMTAKRRIRVLEKEGDRLHRAAVSELFRAEVIDARVLLREREVLENLENAIDRCERVAENLAFLAVKHG
jgi:predicted phosphate transport protein (TIGR00153 family)